ncbi:MAG TPA: nucleoside triphosphate pyrophosphohydrolase, partial [Saprospiraceae bacterium]|nr:nucleoside triphosphate pyrophosphohydrolase [Saprospiraceae bacterium]
TLEEVMSTISKKLIHRHPHIYGDVKVVDEEEVKRNWEQLKLKEGKKGLLSGVPKSLPAMVKSYRLQEKTKQVGFEWDHIDQVWAKVEEEIAELKSNIDQGRPQEEIEDEFGDVIFSLINYGRFLKIDPEAALEKVNRKFISRFEYIEAKAPKPLNDMSLEEMDALWNEAKRVKKEENL